jgi:iron(III) transport system substrate-binding protein
MLLQIAKALTCAPLALLAAGLTPGQAQPVQNWEATIAAAKKEAKLVIYNGSSPGLLDVVSKPFEQRFGISVERLDARPAEIRERIRTEQVAGRFIGDVTITITETLKAQAAGGALQSFGALPSLNRLTEASRVGDPVLPFAIVKWGLLLSNRLVSEGDEPKSWRDLLDPKWKGRILMDDPRTNGGGRFLFAATYKAFGREFHEKLAAQNPVLSPNVALNERRIAQGEYAIYAPQVVPNVGRLAGLPVRPLAPAEGLPYGISGASILKNAPHRDAARLFLEFVLSDEAQEAVTLRGYASVTGYKSAKVPALLQKLNGGPLLGTTTAAETKKMLAAASEIYH